MTLPRLLLALCLLSVPVGALDGRALDVRVAAADEPGLREAKQHFERGQKLYALAKFNEALVEYQKAFDAVPLPDLLFNIGQCHRNLGDFTAATFSYRKYLALAPDAANRERVEQLIRALDTQEAQRDTHRLRLAAPRATPPAAPPPAAPPRRRWWLWASLGIAVAGAGSVLLYEATRPSGPPPTRLGNIELGE